MPPEDSTDQRQICMWDERAETKTGKTRHMKAPALTKMRQRASQNPRLSKCWISGATRSICGNCGQEAGKKAASLRCLTPQRSVSGNGRFDASCGRAAWRACRLMVNPTKKEPPKGLLLVRVATSRPALHKPLLHQKHRFMTLQGAAGRSVAL